MRRETFPDEGFSVMRLSMILTLSVNDEQVICVVFDADFVPLTTALSFSFKEFNAALFFFNVFNFRIKAVLSCLETKTV